jgi:hypothetical protein
MTRAPLILAIWALGATGCSLTSLADRDSPIALNRCDKDTSCPVGSCSRGGFCVAESGSLSTLLFAVSGAAQDLAGQQIFRTVSVNKNGGSVALDLSGVAKIAGTVKATVPAGCDTATTFKGPDSSVSLRWPLDGSVPVRMTFSPSERMLGLPAQSATVLVDVQAGAGLVPDSYPFAARLAAGKYDVYIEPFDIAVTSLDETPMNCGIPPELIRGAEFDGDVAFMHRLPAPSRLDLKIKASDRSTLDHWRVDMLEPVTGRVISRSAELSLPTNTDGTLIYSVSLSYFPVLAGAQQVTGDEIVRLSPPELSSPDAMVAPSLLFQRSALELFAKGQGMIDQLAVLPKPVSFEGRVIDGGGVGGVRATVTLTATSLDGMPKGTLSAFTRSAQTDETGTFSLALLPGTYRVLAVPEAPLDPSQVPFAAREEVWQIAAAPAQQAGRALALFSARMLRGFVITSSGDAARGALVSADPSPGTILTDVFARALGELPLVPRATSAVVDDASGAFTLFADPGSDEKPNLFDVSVRPPAASNFAWYVLPRVPLAADGTGPVELPDLRLPAPVRFSLSVVHGGSTASDVAIQGANVRVYALLDQTGEPTDDASLAKAALPIAESALNAEGPATVLIPPALGRLP